MDQQRTVCPVSALVVAVLAAAMGTACGSSGGAAAGDAGPGADAGGEAGGSSGLTGIVRDKTGTVVAGAKIELGGPFVYSDTQGKYTLAGVPAGAATLKVSRDWFKPAEMPVNVPATGTGSQDLVIEEMPLAIDPDDRTLAESYARSFDWTKQTLSVAIVPRPTRRDFDNAVYFHNPALYRDTSKDAPLAPSPAPTIAGGTAQNFTFPVKSGAHQGEEALELATISDTIAGTPLGPSEPATYMMWTPMVNWLNEGDPAKAADIRAVGLAVRQQAWGSNAQRPQEIEKVYVDAGHGALWVKVVFATFVQLGPGITDSDGDGQKEIFAKVAAVHVAPEVLARLTGEYATVLNTHGLSKELSKSLNELYSTTAAQVERIIGQPFEVPGVGTIKYPFVVLRHSGGQKNVFLVAPAAL
jgi:hypothetical protein